MLGVIFLIHICCLTKGLNFDICQGTDVIILLYNLSANYSAETAKGSNQCRLLHRMPTHTTCCKQCKDARVSW